MAVLGLEVRKTAPPSEGVATPAHPVGLDGIDAPGSVNPEMKAELDRRIEEMDRNPEAGVPWEVVKARALDRLRK